MNADDIKDEETLFAWLDARPDVSREADAVAIAQRFALRVFPVFGFKMEQAWARKDDLTALPLVRPLLAAGAARKYSAPEVSAAARAAPHPAKYLDGDDMGTDAAAYSAADAAYSAARAAAAADNAFARGAYSAAEAAGRAARAYVAARDANDASAAAQVFWAAIRADARLLEQDQDPFVAPLWPAVPPDWFRAADAETRAIWAKDPPGTWDFWLRWWKGVISGNQLDWELQKVVALIPNDVWDAGPVAVAEAIREIELSLARNKTANGERLTVNPETTLVRLIGDTDLPDDIATYARRKMAKALSIFDGMTDNQYLPLEPALKVVRDGLEDAANLPVELFDACASSTRIVAALVRNDVVPSPEQDARINEFTNVLREAGADILANDPKTQDVLTRRNSILGNNALIENAEAIQFVVAQLVTVSEGVLARVLPRDSDLATRTSTEIAEGKDSGFRLVGRILGYKVVQAGLAVAGTGAAIEGFEKTYQTLTWIISTPQFQQAWAAILRWIGFG